MEATSNKPSLLLSKYFQVIHLCLSIAVVFAMVHNQLVNDGRFKKLEQEVYRQENSANTVQEIFPEKKILQSPHNVIKRNVPMGIDKDIKNETTSDSRKEKVIDNSERDVFACLDVLRTFANRSRTNVELNICKQLRGLPGQPGTRGPRGKRGKQGKRGLQGQKGKIGKEGSMGKHGPPGPRGEKGFSGNVTVIGLKGDTGPQGEIGYKGDEGARGPQGNKGSKGEAGAWLLETTQCDAKSHSVTQSSLVINQSRENDSGRYFCEARNVMGVSRYEIGLLIHVYVQFTITPTSITVIKNENIRLRCRASGVPSPVITWQRIDNGPMPNRYRVAMGDLLISGITKQEEGVYKCVASNVLGSRTSEATITVNVFPVIVSFKENTSTINESQTLALPCNATGFPQPEINWYKNNGSFPVGRYAYDSQRLFISNVKYADRGEYICTANNTLGAVSKTTRVIVQVAPKPLLKPKVTEFGYRGHDTMLNFTVFAYPPATIQWMRYGKVIQTLTQSDSSLTLANVQYKDSAPYQAVARNALGEVRVTTFLIVRDPVPAGFTSTINEKKTSVTCLASFERICSALGNPAPTIVWKHKGIILNSKTGGSLKLAIPAVAPSHHGRYTCEASNRFGIARQHFDLDVLCNINVESGCSYSRINRHSGRFTSPNHPGDYANKQQCSWKITSSSNSKIALLFEQFKTEKNYDKVKVYDGGSTSSPSLGVFSGTYTPFQNISTSNQLYITFTTDGSGISSGFSIKYQVTGP